MRKSIVTIMILFSLVLFTGCFKSTSFKTTDKSFYINVPDNFTKRTNVDEADVIFLQDKSSDEDKFRETVAITIEKDKQDVDLKSFYEADLKDYKNFLVNYQEEKLETTTVAGKDAYRVDFKASISEQLVEETRFEFTKYIVKNKDSFYIVVFQMENGKREEFKETLKEIINSVEFN